MDTYAYNTLICIDCLSAVANYDFTGMTAEDEKAVRAGLDRIAENGEHIYLGDTEDMIDFHRPPFGCGVCETRMAGAFYPATIEKG